MYEIKFRLDGLPKTTNAQTGMHWGRKSVIANQWKNRVMQAIGANTPLAPCQKARIVCRRYSSKEPDYDGLVSSFKHVIDGLILARVIADDAMSFIGMPEFSWHKAPPKKGYIEVEVYELEILL